MQMQPIVLDRCTRAVAASFLNAAVIRLVACDCEGKLIVYDFNLLDKSSALVASDICLGEGTGRGGVAH